MGLKLGGMVAPGSVDCVGYRVVPCIHLQPLLRSLGFLS